MDRKEVSQVTLTLLVGTDTKGWKTQDAGNKRYYISPEGTRYVRTKMEVPDAEFIFAEPYREPINLRMVKEDE
jgi:hypothetical protein